MSIYRQKLKGSRTLSLLGLWKSRSPSSARPKPGLVRWAHFRPVRNDELSDPVAELCEADEADAAEQAKGATYYKK